jgi:hypothetical protein
MDATSRRHCVQKLPTPANPQNNQTKLQSKSLHTWITTGKQLQRVGDWERGGPVIGIGESSVARTSSLRRRSASQNPSAARQWMVSTISGRGNPAAPAPAIAVSSSLRRHCERHGRFWFCLFVSSCFFSGLPPEEEGSIRPCMCMDIPSSDFALACVQLERVPWIKGQNFSFGYFKF